MSNNPVSLSVPIHKMEIISTSKHPLFSKYLIDGKEPVPSIIRIITMIRI